jgi:hypothetical protein
MEQDISCPPVWQGLVLDKTRQNKEEIYNLYISINRGKGWRGERRRAPDSFTSTAGLVGSFSSKNSKTGKVFEERAVQSLIDAFSRKIRGEREKERKKERESVRWAMSLSRTRPSRGDKRGH